MFTKKRIESHAAKFIPFFFSITCFSPTIKATMKTYQTSYTWSQDNCLTLTFCTSYSNFLAIYLNRDQTWVHLFQCFLFSFSFQPINLKDQNSLKNYLNFARISLRNFNKWYWYISTTRGQHLHLFQHAKSNKC